MKITIQIDDTRFDDMNFSAEDVKNVILEEIRCEVLPIDPDAVEVSVEESPVVLFPAPPLATPPKLCDVA